VPGAGWNFATRLWWRHRDRLLALLDEQVTATKADPRLAERGDILAMLVQARDEDGKRAGPPRPCVTTYWLSSAPAMRPRQPQLRGARRCSLTVQRYASVRRRPPVVRMIGTSTRSSWRSCASAHRYPWQLAGSSTNHSRSGITSSPPGTLIMVDAWGVHHDPDIYPNPERFEPQRFLAEGREPYTWLPFGGGAHRCIGAALAELEIKVALSTILRKFAIEPVDRETAPPARRAVTLVPHAGGRKPEVKFVNLSDPPGPTGRTCWADSKFRN